MGAFEPNVQRSPQKLSRKLGVVTNGSPSLKGKEPALFVGCPRLVVEARICCSPISSVNCMFDHFEITGVGAVADFLDG